MSEEKVVELPGAAIRRAVVEAAAAAAGPRFGDIVVAAAHLAIAKAVTSTFAPNITAWNSEQRVQDLAYRLGHVRGLIEVANELLDNLAPKAPPPAVKADPVPSEAEAAPHA